MSDRCFWLIMILTVTISAITQFAIWYSWWW